MKTLLLIFVFSWTTIIFSQVEFTTHIITTSADGAGSVYAVDVDGDGDIDVLSASSGDDKIAWYENDGNGNFTPHTITTNADGASSVYAIDVDGDGDIDVLSASYEDDKIAWYENDGNENFTSHTITTSAGHARSVYALDLDGDGDIDVLSASSWDYKIAWYENDGNENFISHTITTVAGGLTVYAIDVDGDGDVDVLSDSTYYDHFLVWYENDGNENFTPHMITWHPARLNTVYAVDMDSDGDIDVLSAFGDLFWGYAIGWSENDGNENFTHHFIQDPLDYYTSVFAVDVNGDGDIDVLSASNFDDKIAWYENLSPVGINDNNPLDIPVQFHLYSNFPNPFNSTSVIKYSIPQSSNVIIKVFDILGNEIETLVNEEKSIGIYKITWTADNLPSGIYLYQLRASSYLQTRKMVIMK